MSEIVVKLDTKEFEQRLMFASREGVNAMRRAVDRAARAARKEAIKVMSKDIGAPVSKFRSAVPLVKASTQSNISATWTISKKRLSLLETGARFTPILSSLRGSASGSTFRATGGGSASLDLPKAFILNASNGARLLMVRTGRGRAAIKGVYAAMPNTTMSQDDGAPRVLWKKIAERELSNNLGAEIQRALDGAAGPSPSLIGAGERWGSISLTLIAAGALLTRTWLTGPWRTWLKAAHGALPRLFAHFSKENRYFIPAKSRFAGASNDDAPREDHRIDGGICAAASHAHCMAERRWRSARQ